MKSLTLESVKPLFPNARQRTYGKGQIVCYQQDTPQNVYFIISGYVRYYDIDKTGNEKILHLMGPNNIFPMLFAYGISKEVDAFYSTVDDTELLTIPIEDFRQALKTNIDLANSLTKWFLMEIDQLVYRINGFERNDAKNKVLHALKYLALNFGHTDWEWQEINFPLTQQFIADFTGLTRETVSAAMSELERTGKLSPQKRRLVAVKASILKVD